MKSERRTLWVGGIGENVIPNIVATSVTSRAGVVGVCLLQDIDVDASLLVERPSSVPYRTLIKPKERYLSSESVRAVRAQEKAVEKDAIPGLLKQLFSFAAKVRANDFWFVLDGQTSLRLAHLALMMGKRSVRVEVPQDPSNRFKALNVEKRTVDELLMKYDDVMARAASVAVASWALAADLDRRWGRHATVMLPSLDTALALDPATRPRPETLRVGVAGASYSSPEFFSLVEAMIGLKSEKQWHSIELHAFVDSAPKVAERDGSVIRIRQIKDTGAFINDLSKLDLLFLSCPFQEPVVSYEQQIVAKLALYLASGRPVMFHGRSDLGVARLLRETSASFFCFREGGEAVRAALGRSVRQGELYAEIAARGRRLLESHFSIEAHGELVHEFIGRSSVSDTARRLDARTTSAIVRRESAR